MALLRAGATRETIADTAGVPVHVVRRIRAAAGQVTPRRDGPRNCYFIPNPGETARCPECGARHYRDLMPIGQQCLACQTIEAQIAKIKTAVRCGRVTVA